MNENDAPECVAAREALSALLDHEEPGVGVAWLTEHVMQCPGCREWHAAAQELSRGTRVAMTPDLPPLRSMILAAVSGDAPAPGPVRRRWSQAPRIVVAACGLLLLWMSAPLLLLGRDPDAGVHPAHELGSFEVALALTLLVAACRPRLAHVIWPLVGLVAVLLVTTALVDLAHQGRTTWSDEAPHLLWLVAFLAMLAMPHTSEPMASAMPTSRPDALHASDTVMGPSEPPSPRRAEGGGTPASHLSA